MSEKMTDGELNERLAKALGWKYDHEYGEAFRYEGACNTRASGPFSPATSVDDLRDYVLPVLVDRGLEQEFRDEVVKIVIMEHDGCGPAMPFSTEGVAFLMTDTPVLAEAALRVLEEEK